MFYNCSSLTSLDVSSFDTHNVTDMGTMFGKCSSLTTLDLSSFDTSKVTKMDWMFYTCDALTSIKFGKNTNESASRNNIFKDTTTTGTLYYPSEYADNYANLIAAIPSTWTAVAY
jgi:surface protein